MNELKEMAKAKEIFIYMTKQDVIELLNKLEPGVDHSRLKGKTLIEVKKKHHIGSFKNKQQLIRAIEKTVREEVVT